MKIDSKKIEIFMNTMVFLAIIILVGMISFANLAKFYIKKEINYNEWSPELGNKFETDEATTFFQKFQLISMNGAIRNALGQKEMNGVLKLSNNHLTISQKKMSSKEIAGYANEVIKFSSFCKEEGKPFLFVQPILKVDENNKQLPIGTEDYSNENINIFLQYLREADIDVLDIRECMKKDEMNLYDYTFKTDHHWNTKGAFYTFTKIVDWIGQTTGVVADQKITEYNNYTIKRYEKVLLGSYGQRVGEYFAGIDDYDLIMPSFDVSFIKDGVKHSFIEQAVNESVFHTKGIKSRYVYDYALNIPEGVATTSQKLSILFITDSYAKAVAPYMKLAYSDYTSDYYPSGFNAEHIREMNPDVVVLMPFNTSTFDNGAVYIK